MRIWIVNHYALPPTLAGGTRHYNFARELIALGHEVMIIAANYNHFSHAYIPTTSNIGEIDYTYEVPFLWIPTPPYKGNTIARFWNMLMFAKRLLQKKYLRHAPKPDVIIGSSPDLFAALGAEILSRQYKIPFVLEIRDIWPDTLVDLGRISERHPLITLMKLIEKRLYRQAKHIITLLPNAFQYLYAFGVKHKCITWLPNAIHSAKIDVPPYTHQNSKFTVMYAGAHGLANDLDTVIDAAKILQNELLADAIEIQLIGDGPDKARLQTRAREENVKNIIFKNAVPKDKIYALLNEADTFIMLLKDSPVFKWGISPNKLFDYLLMKKPIIFGVNTSFNPIQEVNAGLSIQPSDPKALANAIVSLAALPKHELEAMGARGKEFVLKNHNVPYLTKQLEMCLQQALNSSL